MGEAPPATPSTVMPSAWVDRLFSRLVEIYGPKWLDYVEVAGGPEPVAKLWAAGLHGLLPEEIKRGLYACMTNGKAWVPTVGEFRALCRPPRDAEAEFKRAALILGHQPIDWQGDAVLFATVRAVGSFEVRSLPYTGNLKARWERALREAEQADRLPKPPEPPKALIEEKPTERGKAIDILADLKARFFGADQP